MSHDAAFYTILGVGLAVLVGGVGAAIHSHMHEKLIEDDIIAQRRRMANAYNKRMSQIHAQQRRRAEGQSLGPHVIGRPFSNPYESTATMWGEGPWAHRTPRMRPI
jgi:hypothetical protein